MQGQPNLEEALSALKEGLQYFGGEISKTTEKPRPQSARTNKQKLVVDWMRKVTKDNDVLKKGIRTYGKLLEVSSTK
jgi:hypothetical protein